jgi:hypothetical protein
MQPRDTPHQEVVADSRAWAQQLLRQTQPRVILSAIDLCDGHGIVSPEAFLSAGVHPDIVKHLNTLHMSSDDDYMQAIIGASGQHIEACKGVRGLAFLELACDAFGIAKPPFIGRGSQADWMKKKLRDAVSGESSSMLSTDLLRRVESMSGDALYSCLRLFGRFMTRSMCKAHPRSTDASDALEDFIHSSRVAIQVLRIAGVPDNLMPQRMTIRMTVEIRKALEAAYRRVLK